MPACVAASLQSLDTLGGIVGCAMHSLVSADLENRHSSEAPKAVHLPISGL